MNEFENNAYFWQKVDAAYMSGNFRLVYKKGSIHKQYPDLLFPCDYGHVETVGGNDAYLKVFRGSRKEKVEGIVVCANLLEKDLTTIVLVGVSDEEREAILRFLNSNDYQKTVVINRGNNIPSWAVTE
ncbi:MAG: Inorganic pyrophosphatase [Erysipelotrichaceae bacterium]|nr:Inorganic pyrophosphatase [Erysipelotrichaceae bacterium]